MKAFARLLVILALMAPALASAQTVVKAPPPTCRLFASATIVGYNTKVRLDWASRNATGGYLTSIGTIGPNGSAYVVPGRNTTYAASFSGPGGAIVCRVAVAVQPGGVGTGTGGAYGGGVVNIDGTTDVRGSSIDATGSAIDTNNPVDTTGSTIDTNNPVDTNNPINTNTPVNLNGTVNLGGKVVLPTIPDFTPTPASGSSGFIGGIVPQECRGQSTVANCDLCSLAQLGQNLANFLLGLTIPAAALLFAWAGILYFSSRGNPAQITQAHNVFKTVVIGVVIALSAWVLVNTVMNGLIHRGSLGDWDWRSLKCTETRKARLYNMSLSQYLSSLKSTTQSYAGSFVSNEAGCPAGATPEGGRCIDYTGGRAIDVGAATGGGSSGGGGVFDSCPTGYAYTSDEGGYCQSADPNIPDAWTEACPRGYVYNENEGGYCADPSNPNRWVEVDGTGGAGNPGDGTRIAVGSGTRGRAICPDYNPYCSTAALQQDGFNEAEARAMSCIAMTENSGRAAGCSGTGPCGVYQISRTNWNEYAPAGCTAADFGGNLTAAQNNGDCNRRVAGEMHDDVGYQPWTGLCNTPGGCNVGTVHAVGYGQPWNPAARACVANYDPDNL